ncbi:MAG: glycerophosphodiester phosphodiesterase [Gammaproteobacteria bacterium]
MCLETNPLRSREPWSLGVLKIAHRGARAYAPENTLQSFRKAKAFGCDMFELDVHLSKDGELIVHHDDELTRCTDVTTKFPGRTSYFVSDFTYDELLQLDAGSWYATQLQLPPPKRQFFLQTLSDREADEYVSRQEREYFASGEIKLPTLHQALELARDEAMMVNIEIKTLPRMYSGITEAVVGLVEKMAFENRVLISSFDHEQLIVVRQLNQRIATGVLTSDRLARPGDYLEILDADAYNPGCYGDYDSMGFGAVKRRLDPIGIAHARNAGRGVNVWTCNDTIQMEEMMAAGVTGLITDFPNRFP